MKRSMAVLVAALLVVTLAGCGKKEEKKAVEGAGSIANLPETTPPGMGSPAGMPPGMGGEGAPQMPPPGMGQGGMGMGQASAPKQVVVPDEVKKQWPAVKLRVVDKKKNEEKSYEVKAGQTIKIPGSNLSVQVGQYLPDFAMDGQTITSKSGEPNNPTVRLTITEGDKEVFKGWAFEKYPEAHAFSHPDFGVTLEAGVRAK